MTPAMPLNRDALMPASPAALPACGGLPPMGDLFMAALRACGGLSGGGGGRGRLSCGATATTPPEGRRLPPRLRGDGCRPTAHKSDVGRVSHVPLTRLSCDDRHGRVSHVGRDSHVLHARRSQHHKSSRRIPPRHVRDERYGTREAIEQSLPTQVKAAGYRPAPPRPPHLPVFRPRHLRAPPRQHSRSLRHAPRPSVLQ